MRLFRWLGTGVAIAAIAVMGTVLLPGVAGAATVTTCAGQSNGSVSCTSNQGYYFNYTGSVLGTVYLPSGTSILPNPHFTIVADNGAINIDAPVHVVGNGIINSGNVPINGPLTGQWICSQLWVTTGSTQSLVDWSCTPVQ